MSAINSGGAGGEQPHGDPSGHGNSFGGGGDDKDPKDDPNRKPGKNWSAEGTSSSVNGFEAKARSGGRAASTTSSVGSVPTSGISIVEDNDADAAAGEAEESLRYREELEQATRNSILTGVGAYSVVPGSVPSRRDGSYIDGGGASDGGGTNTATSVMLPSNIYHSNLPPNIDFIAEATLVPQQDEEDPQDEQEDGDDDDVDTLGLPPHISPEVGGAMDNDGVSVLSGITNPTTMENMSAASPEMISFRSCERGESSGAPLIITSSASADNAVTDEEALLVDDTACEHDVSPGSNGPSHTSVTHSAHQQPQQLNTVYEAEIVEDGPMNVLRSKYGRGMCFSALAIILVLSLGLAFGLKAAGRANPTKESEPQTDPKEVLSYAAGDFCNAATPELFFDNSPSYCKKDEVSLGGTLQQAVAIAQRRPHPSCDSVETGSKTPQSLMGWHYCTVTNVTPQISLLNGGAVRGEIEAHSPITREMVSNILPFQNNTVAYIQLKGSEIVKVLENSVAFVMQENPLNPFFEGGYPYASGLKFQVDLTAPNGTDRVSNVTVLDSDTGEYIPIDPSSSYWIVTNSWIAEGGDNYLNDITPLQIVPTNLRYTKELETFLSDLEGEWVPPTKDEMSTVSFNATGLEVSSIKDAEPPLPSTNGN